MIREALCWALLLAGMSGPPPASPGDAAGIKVRRLDARLDQLLAPGMVPEKVADGFHWVEGPVWNRSGGYLLFSDIPANSIYKWKPGEGTSLFLEPSGYTGAAPFQGREPGSNGLAFDAQGRLVLAEHGDRRIARLEPEHRKTTLADRFQGKRLNSPNDVVVTSSGDIYFTDPPFGLPGTFQDPQKELDFTGVYRLRGGSELQLLISDLPAANGIALSPDEKLLYVSNADPESPVWMVYEINQDGTPTNGRVFYDARPWVEGRQGLPDGMKTDRQGNLFAAGPGGLYIFAPDGTLLGMIDMGVATSNCGWGKDDTVLYITAGTAVYRLPLRS